MTLDLIRKAILDFDWYNYGLDDVADGDPEYAEYLAKRILAAITPTTSVLRPWVMELPLRHQGTLLAAVRGCDNVPKRPYDTMSRALVAYLRYTFLVPADPNEVTVPGAFMRTSPPERWRPSDLGHLPEHFYSHLMHAFEVVGYCCPHPETAQECEFIYLQLVHGLHLQPETREQMYLRLTEDRVTSGTVVSLCRTKETIFGSILIRIVDYVRLAEMRPNTPVSTAEIQQNSGHIDTIRIRRTSATTTLAA